MSRQTPSLLLNLVTLMFFFFLILFPVCRLDAQLQFGYQVGDVYSFTDSTVETFDANSTHLYEETSHTFQIQIQAIEENTSYNSIEITAQVLNLSAGLEDFVQSATMEGYTFIVASPSIYFTHTQWDLHVIDFLDSVNNYQQATQMTGIVEYNQDSRYFHWNMSKFIPSAISLFDTDDDGQMDAYTVISRYTAVFTSKGVVELREFVTENRFTNGALYYRNHHISLNTQISIPFSPLTPFTIGIIVVTTIILAGLTVFLFRRQAAIR